MVYKSEACPGFSSSRADSIFREAEFFLLPLKKYCPRGITHMRGKSRFRGGICPSNLLNHVQMPIMLVTPLITN